MSDQRAGLQGNASWGDEPVARAWPVIVANMVERGATATPEETKTIADYLAANFGN